MVVEFKQAVNFFGKFYVLGLSEVPAKVVDHPFFKLMQSKGLALEVLQPPAGVVVQQGKGLVQEHKEIAAKANQAAKSLETEAEEPAKKQKKG